MINKILASSVNPEKLSLTIKGILVGLAPVLLVIFGVSNINVGQEDLNQIIDATSNAIISVGGTISAIMILWGAIRKVLVLTDLIK